MTKIELADKLLAYEPDAQLSVLFKNGETLMPIGELQDILREWKASKAGADSRNWEDFERGWMVFCEGQARLLKDQKEG